MTARILIVDDVPANVRLLETRLAAEYYQVATAQDGLEAIRAAHAYQPDLIFLDVMMPNMDGYEACRQLKADPETLHIPVVMVTALTEPSERLLGLEAGADDFLTKPVEYDTLLARTRSLVRLKRMLDELRARGETARALGVAGESPVVNSISGARALVVDDDDESARGIQDALSHEGVIPGRASTEAEAMALTSAVPFDLIVLSVSLKNDDPLRLASRLRAADTTHEIPLLLVAAKEKRDRILRGFELGANDWIRRPVDENELRARARNLIKRKFYQDRLRADVGSALEMALTDPLTGFYNQRYLMRHLRGLLASNQGGGIALMMIDVDHFKMINDQYGHQVGDRALKAIAEMLRNRTRVFDTVARYGGEEFVVVMPGADGGEVELAAERLRLSIDQMAFSPQPGVQIHITVSIGFAYCEATNIAAELLLKAADQAMYQAKNGGRNRVVMAPPILVR
jgi:two-component system, cell cycle response regulator